MDFYESYCRHSWSPGDVWPPTFNLAPQGGQSFSPIQVKYLNVYKMVWHKLLEIRGSRWSILLTLLIPWLLPLQAGWFYCNYWNLVQTCSMNRFLSCTLRIRSVVTVVRHGPPCVLCVLHLQHTRPELLCCGSLPCHVRCSGLFQYFSRIILNDTSLILQHLRCIVFIFVFSHSMPLLLLHPNPMWVNGQAEWCSSTLTHWLL